MTKETIQSWMLGIFIFALAISIYKIYVIFAKPAPGIDVKTQHLELQAIILNFLRESNHTDISPEELFILLQDLDELKNETYRNFNQNRLNQLLQQLYHIHKVSSLSELIRHIRRHA